MSENKPVVVIGLDGATWRLLDPWIKAGELPTLGQIRSKSVWGSLDSCLPPVTSPAWKCYSTGKNPGKLGVYWWEIVDTDERSISVPDSRSFRSPELWDYLGDAGLRWAVFNMPTTFPPHGDDNGGMMVSGVNAEPNKIYTAPASLKTSLEEQFDYKPIPERRIDERGAVTEIYELIDLRFEVAKWLLKTESLSFLHLTTALTNKLHHYFWDGAETKEGWKRIDDHLAWFLDRGYNLVFISDHGSNEIRTEFKINSWLEAQEYLFQSTDRSAVAEVGAKRGLTQEDLSRLAARFNIREVARSFLPERIIEYLPQKNHTKGEKTDVIDWGHTQALASGQGLIYLTRPNAPNAESVRNQIKTDLKTLTDPDGNPVVIDVYDTEKIYWGSHLDLAPDLIAEQAEGIHMEDRIGTHEIFGAPTDWRGENERSGIFMAHGPSFDTNRTLSDTSIMDIAPTLLHLLDVPIPSDIDGSVIEVFAPDSEPAEREPVYQNPRPVPTRGSAEVESAEERLQELGYLN